ncbi:unnamed protein product [Ceutorhynchus assimilis]|uniref:LysM domain-containing protein n=1 Tax=Ceutorhynchus assimilis TaxID=467358 RepID=A0A9N9M9L5_9CUCU|nr:unnamed protein product [Ceutorhynchus assimilis]
MTGKKVDVSIPMSLLSFSKSVDRGSYEKLSIRDSARSLKKYGATSSKNATKNECYIKHFVGDSDTLQGVALKYNVTIEQIRRANKLWASDSLFLRESLLIPQPENANIDLQSSPESSQTSFTLTSPSAESLNQNVASCSTTRSLSFEEENISDFLSKIDASIANTKEVVQKVTRTSEFGTDQTIEHQQRRPRPQSRLKQQQQQNNNVSGAPLNTVVVQQQGKKVRTSLELHEQQQEELFEL